MHKNRIATYFSFLFIMTLYSAAFAAEGIVWDRVRLMPALTLSEIYSDNIYRTPDDQRDDFVTSVNPMVSLDFALAPQNILSLRYNGYFRTYEKSENFKKYIYQYGLAWAWTAPKGSTFKVEANEDRNSVQPYSVADTHKDYVERGAFADVVLKSLRLADIGFRYDHASRKFADSLYSSDDFTLDSGTVNATYWALPSTGFLIQYAYAHQNNYNQPVAPTMDSQIVLAGIHWGKTDKLSGHLKAGYYYTKVEGSASDDGFAMDSDLAYEASDFTRLSLTAFRRPIRSTSVERETGAFYISTGGDASVSYTRWRPITMTAGFSYVNNAFKEAVILTNQERRDNYTSAGLGINYSLRDWLKISINYHYQVNDSNVNAYGYRANMLEASVSAAI